MTTVTITRAPRKGANMTDAERDTRVNLAACYRLIAHFDMDDKTSTHISARVPGTTDEFLLNPRGRLFQQIRASDLVKVNLDGQILDDTRHDVIRAG